MMLMLSSTSLFSQKRGINRIRTKSIVEEDFIFFFESRKVVLEDEAYILHRVIEKRGDVDALNVIHRHH